MGGWQCILWARLVVALLWIYCGYITPTRHTSSCRNISGKWRQFAVVYNHIDIFSKNDMIQAFKANNKWFWIYFINTIWGVGGSSNGKHHYKGVYCNLGWHYFLKENIRSEVFSLLQQWSFNIIHVLSWWGVYQNYPLAQL